MTDVDANEANVLYTWDLLSHAGKLPLDVVSSLLTSHSIKAAKANCAGRRRMTGGYIQCPRCNIPRIANLFKVRILGRPHKRQLFKKLVKKEKKHGKKLTTKEKHYLASFRSQANTIEVTCLVCHYKMQEPFPGLVKEKPVEECVTEVNTKKKKKRRKSVKEVNAGLIIPNKTSEKLFNPSVGNEMSDNMVKPDDICKSKGMSKVKNLTRKDFINTHNVNKDNDALCKLKKPLSERIEKSITYSDKLGSSKCILLDTASQNSKKARKEKFKKLSYMQNVVIKDTKKDNSGEKSLGDFLSSIF